MSSPTFFQDCRLLLNNSGTDKTAGALADIDIIPDGKFEPSLKDISLTYQAN